MTSEPVFRGTPPESITIALIESVRHFLHQEARLLDTHQFDEWLALYTADATYWVPLEQNQADPYEISSIIHDDRTLLELRVRQITHPRAHARRPLARTVHQVGNVQILSHDADETRVASTLVLVEYRLEQQRTWAALVEHRLRLFEGRWCIAAKRVDLINSEAELPGIAFLL
jgi:3-phenylpropionate/cinnamic acid dioxygenase small subunit